MSPRESRPALPEKITRRKLSDQVFDRLRALIASGELQAGDPMPSERDLMERFGVGRPAVREALQHRHETKCGGRDAKRTPWGPKCGAARPYESPNGGFSYRRGWGAGVLFFRVTAPSSLPPSLNAVAHSAGRA